VEETREIENASRAALKQTRELVSEMRALKVDEEIKHMEQIVTAAEINFTYRGPEDLINLPPLTQNMVAMCIREAGTNIVKHSQATTCSVDIHIADGILSIVIFDNGIGINEDTAYGNGLKGMEERLTFIEGALHINSKQGTCLNLSVPLGGDWNMIRIVIAKDQRILRGAIGTLLDFEEDFEIVGQAGDGEEAMTMIQRGKPDICLLDKKWTRYR